jgi:hypothetical protein
VFVSTEIDRRNVTYKTGGNLPVHSVQACVYYTYCFEGRGCSSSFVDNMLICLRGKTSQCNKSIAMYLPAYQLCEFWSWSRSASYTPACYTKDVAVYLLIKKQSVTGTLCCWHYFFILWSEQPCWTSQANSLSYSYVILWRSVLHEKLIVLQLIKDLDLL